MNADSLQPLYMYIHKPSQLRQVKFAIVPTRRLCEEKKENGQIPNPYPFFARTIKLEFEFQRKEE
ncbi:hypothetical protein LguiA_025993 [Lonicera macranthoides]